MTNFNFSMSSKATPMSLAEKFEQLNNNLSYCNENLIKMLQNPIDVNFNIEIEEKEINNQFDTEKLRNKDITAKIDDIAHNYEEDLKSLEKLEKYLEKERKKKDRLEERQKNSRILNEVYKNIDNEIKQKNDKCINEEQLPTEKNLSIKNAEKKIDEKANDLYKEYESVLETNLSLIRNNYMKSATDTVFLTVKNLADTLLSSYAFKCLSYKIENDLPSQE